MTSDLNWERLAIQASTVFSPTAPIDERSLFAGRDKQVRQVIDAINQRGQHAILYGERGVGKTSLANVLSSFFIGGTNILAPRINCDTTDSFASVWAKVLDQIELTSERPVPGFSATPQTTTNLSADLIEGSASPNAVRKALTILANNFVPILIIDEFDRLPEEPRRAFADTIKTLSDYAVAATVVLVGVADSVDQLIAEHHSVERALVQVPMPRMSTPEIRKIVDTGLQRLGMKIENGALRRVVLLSQGLPHYTHLISLYAVREAVDSQTLTVTEDIVSTAIQKALEGAQQSIQNAWHQAISSPRPDNLFSDVLLACALAQTDQLGFFAAQDVRKPMRTITGKQYDIPSFARHLNEFCDQKRGPVLRKTGVKRRYRFRFVNPLMQPYVIMQGFKTGRLKKGALEKALNGDIPERKALKT